MFTISQDKKNLIKKLTYQPYLFRAMFPETRIFFVWPKLLKLHELTADGIAMIVNMMRMLNYFI